MKTQVLEVSDLRTYYGESYVLQGISLRVPPNSTVGVLGRNGAGKTTLLHSIMGIIFPRGGSILFRDIDITLLPPYRRLQKGIALVPQGRRIFPSLSALENLRVAERNPDGRSQWNIDTVLEIFPLLRKRLMNRGNELSGGEQQMLAIGRALISNPLLLLLDEPTEGLAPLLVEELLAAFRMLKQKGLSILLVEQNLRFATHLADYVYVMNSGVKAFECASDELQKNKELIQRYLGIVKD